MTLREIEGRLRVAERMAACIEDPRASNHVTHSMADIIRFRLLMIAAGYEDGNDADSLRSDPMFKMALDLTPSDRELCSQPTISRLENLPDARALLRISTMAPPPASKATSPTIWHPPAARRRPQPCPNPGRRRRQLTPESLHHLANRRRPSQQ